MAKRHSRVYADEPVFFDDSTYTSLSGSSSASSSGSSFQSRRSSRSSFRDDLLQSAADTDDVRAHMPMNDALASIRHQNTTATRDVVGLEKSGILAAAPRQIPLPYDVVITAKVPSLLPTIPQTVEYPVAPADGRPLNFGVIVPGFYRSSYPRQHDHEFLKSLKLKTVVTLAKKEELQDELHAFVTDNGIRHVTFDMKGTKKEAIPIDTMASILQLTLDKRNYPLLIHCNHGKHRTGCVVAAARRVAGWDVDPAVDEYRAFASPKVRECDIDYINAFQSSLIPRHEDDSYLHSTVHVSTFVRTLLFSTVVVAIWIVSGSQMAAAPASTAENY